MSQPPYFGSRELTSLLPMIPLVAAIESAFRSDAGAPERAHHPAPGGSLLVMPAWDGDGYVGVKLVTIHPENPRTGLPSIQGVFTLFNPSGTPVASMDAGALTLLRTAATSALAARHMARPDSSCHMVVGAGRLAPWLARSMAEVFSISRCLIWNRTPDRARDVARELEAGGLNAVAVSDLAAGLRQADIVSTATMSRSPLLQNEHVREGTHLDLVGAYTPEMCEAEASLIARGRVVVDTWGGAKSEAGDLIRAVASGAMVWDDIETDLRGLMSGAFAPRTPEDITVFKSVGAAEEDLAAARLALLNHDR